MLKSASFACGMYVHNLFIRSRITCVSISTSNYAYELRCFIYTQILSKTHILFTSKTHRLSPAYSGVSPLMNTLFTQFPHPLLLLERNEI